MQYRTSGSAPKIWIALFALASIAIALAARDFSNAIGAASTKLGERNERIARQGQSWGIPIGATPNFVRDRIGEPSGVTTTKSATGTQEIWTYESVTIRFENSRVASVQSHGQ